MVGLNDIALFVQVVRSGSFAGAARRLGVPSNTVSRRPGTRGATRHAAAVLAAHPRVRLDFVLSDARADLIAERIDVAFRGGALRDSGYVGRQVLRDCDDVLVASPTHLAARGSPDTRPQEP